MDHKLKKLIPLKLKNSIKMHMHARRITKGDKKILLYFEKNNIKNAILSCGWRKSGNTWFKFVLYNYFNILINNANKTLTFEELKEHDIGNLEGGYTKPRKPGFPVYYSTHEAYRRIFSYFFRVIFIYRNPLDACLSYYYNRMDRVTNFRGGFPNSEIKKLYDIDYFALYNLPYWIYHYKSTIDKADAVLCYEEMRKNPYSQFHKAFKEAGIEINENALAKSIEMSSFDNIRKMGRETNQRYGAQHPKIFKGEFTRSGKSKQYTGTLKAGTIQKAQKLLNANRIDIVL
ncbi:MAG: sulfotransferase domain-containing protein [Candidatus Omnitrophica bacterium]|nr:sulfotransferase domain-containing protein [Candidatus Omnitrophota bacterium]